MANTNEFDCTVCGSHFDDARALQDHNQQSHSPMQAMDVREPAEPMGTERAREDKNPRASTRDGSPTPRFGSAGSGGAEFEPGPERN